jgi:hypothetical protein
MWGGSFDGKSPWRHRCCLGITDLRYRLELLEMRNEFLGAIVVLIRLNHRRLFYSDGFKHKAIHELQMLDTNCQIQSETSYWRN